MSCIFSKPWLSTKLSPNSIFNKAVRSNKILRLDKCELEKFYRSNASSKLCIPLRMSFSQKLQKIRSTSRSPSDLLAGSEIRYVFGLFSSYFSNVRLIYLLCVSLFCSEYYERKMRESNTLDFQDFIYLTTSLFDNEGYIHEVIKWKNLVHHFTFQGFTKNQISSSICSCGRGILLKKNKKSFLLLLISILVSFFLWSNVIVSGR